MRTWRAARTAVYLILVASILPGCVGKKVFQSELERLDGRVGDVEGEVEANQKRINDLKRSTDSKLSDLEGESQKALQTGRQALDEAKQARQDALGKLIWTVTMTDDQIRFDFGEVMVTSNGMGTLDRLAEQVKARGRQLYLEIEGHTDNVGSATLNQQLGRERAHAVLSYLNEKGKIPLHAMNTISFGEARPIADNSTKEGRAQNRRVVIRVLE